MDVVAFEKLREHLGEVRPIFDEFCARNHFEYAAPSSIGRYPRIRVFRQGPITLWIDLWMEYDKEGRRFEAFRRDLPYELSAGASAEVDEGRARVSLSDVCFSGKPFELVGAELKSEMERALKVIEKWDLQYIKDSGKNTLLRTSSSRGR